MKIICNCGQILSLKRTDIIDEKNRKQLIHPNYNQEEIEIYEFRDNEHALAFYCNGCQEIFIYNIEHRD